LAAFSFEVADWAFPALTSKLLILNAIVEVFVALEVEWTQQTRSD